MLQSYTPSGVVAIHRAAVTPRWTFEIATESGFGVGMIARAEARCRFMPALMQPANVAAARTPRVVTRIRPSDGFTDATPVARHGSSVRPNGFRATVRHDQQANSRGQEKPAIDRPLRLARHEASRKDVDSLQEPRTAHEQTQD